jgi:hypothetical protein
MSESQEGQQRRLAARDYTKVGQEPVIVADQLCDTAEPP